MAARAGKPRLRGDGEGRRLAGIDEERCELTQGRHYRLPGTTVPVGERTFARGDEHWIAFQVRVGDDWNADTPLFNNIMQLKNHGTGGPPLKMAIDEGRIELGGIDRSYQSAPNYQTLWSSRSRPTAQPLAQVPAPGPLRLDRTASSSSTATSTAQAWR